MRKGNQSVFYSVQKEAGALSACNVVNVPESLVNYPTHEASPSKKTLCGVFDACIGRHKQNTVTVFKTAEVTGGSTAHASSKNDYVLFFDAANSRKVIVYGFWIFANHLFIWFTAFVKAVAGVLNRQNMHLHFCSKQIHQVKCKSDVFCVSVEVYNKLVTSILTRQIQARNVLNQLLLLLCLLYLRWCLDSSLLLLTFFRWFSRRCLFCHCGISFRRL